MKGFFKSGGSAPTPSETNQVQFSNEISDTTTKRYIAVPCRARNKVSPDLQPRCWSYTDPERPGWYLTVRSNGDIYYEPEYAPTNPETFDNDTSYISHIGEFFPGFFASESLSMPNHIFRAVDGRVAVMEFEDTPEFRNAASMYILDRSKKGNRPICLHSVNISMYVSCNGNGRQAWALP